MFKFIHKALGNFEKTCETCIYLKTNDDLKDWDIELCESFQTREFKFADTEFEYHCNGKY